MGQSHRSMSPTIGATSTSIHNRPRRWTSLQRTDDAGGTQTRTHVKRRRVDRVSPSDPPSRRRLDNKPFFMAAAGLVGGATGRHHGTQNKRSHSFRASGVVYTIKAPTVSPTC
ncbi:unnamed protein product [Merluccius merluccius]